MKFFNITDTSAFFDKVLSCTGNVYCVCSDGSLWDLKQTARQFSECSWLAKPAAMNEINVVVEQATDSRRLFRYMMEVCRAK